MLMNHRIGTIAGLEELYREPHSPQGLLWPGAPRGAESTRRL